MANTLLDSPYIPPEALRQRVHATQHARVIIKFDWSEFAANENLSGNACLETVHVQTDANRTRVYVYVFVVFQDGVGSGNEEWRIVTYQGRSRAVGGEERCTGHRQVGRSSFALQKLQMKSVVRKDAK